MLKAEQMPSEVIRKAMHAFQFQMDEEEHSVGESWAIILAAAINAWPGMFYHPARPDEEACIFLPLPTESTNDKA